MQPTPQAQPTAAAPAQPHQLPPGSYDVGHITPEQMDALKHSQDPKDQLIEALRAILGPNDVVLVKASRGLALETVAAALAAHDEGESHP